MAIEYRVIRMSTCAHAGATVVRAAIEDRFHNFRIEAHLFEGSVTSVDIDPIRYPYTLCPAAGSQLNLLSGQPVSRRMSDYSRNLDSRHQCTHQFDVAVMALALAARGVTQRRYDIEAEELAPDHFTGTVLKDGLCVLEMEVRADVIVSPAELAGQSLGSGFTGVVSTLDEELAESALLLRRMIYIVINARLAEEYERADHAPPFAGCWVQQPTRNKQAERIRGNILAGDTLATYLTGGDDEYLLFSSARDESV